MKNKEFFRKIYLINDDKFRTSSSFFFVAEFGDIIKCTFDFDRKNKILKNINLIHSENLIGRVLVK